MAKVCILLGLCKHGALFSLLALSFSMVASVLVYLPLAASTQHTCLFQCHGRVYANAMLLLRMVYFTPGARAGVTPTGAFVNSTAGAQYVASSGQW